MALGLTAITAGAEGINFYALLDGGLAHSKISGPGTTGNKTEFVTGGYAPNFFGIKGEKSLGDGYTGGFNLEQGFLLQAPNNSAAWAGYANNSRFSFGDDSLFNRQANLYISGAFGKLTIGTQPNIAFNSVLAVDPRFGSDFGSSLATIVADGKLGTIDNGSISYASPTINGLSGSIQYVPSGPSASSTISSGARGSLNYSGDGYTLTLASYSNHDKTGTSGSHGYVTGGTKKLSDFTLKVLYANQSNNAYSGLSTTGLGGAYSLAPKTTLDVGYYKSSKGAAYDMKTTGVGVQHKFLKDLTLYAQYAQVKNSGTDTGVYNFLPPNGSLFNEVITTGQKATSINVGFLYAFF